MRTNESMLKKVKRLTCTCGWSVCMSLIPFLVYAADCTRTSVGFTPLNDLGAGSYQGFQGGLYPGGSNLAPSTHTDTALSRALAIEPLDATGNPSTAGNYVLLSIGMSNTSMEFGSGFIPIANQDADKDSDLVIVNGAQGGQTANDIADPNAAFWSVIEGRLASAGVTTEQVTVVWMKQANGAGNLPAETYRTGLQEDLEAIAQLLPQKYPNIQVAYLSSRIYAGYASTNLNPEPYAYESGLAVKWVIEKQINGDASLNFDAQQGAVNAPLLVWGPYLWADGLVARSDGLTYACSDFNDDGTHPSPSGQDKVGEQLHGFFTTNLSARQWYLENPGLPDTVPPAPPTQLIAQ